MLKDDKLNMIMEFADGTLDAGKEDKLFLLLSTDEEMKQQFKSHIGIKNAIKASAGNVVLPASSKAAVFSALSLDMPVTAGSASATSHKLLWSAATVSVAILAFLFFFLNKNESGDTIPVNNSTTPAQQVEKQVLPGTPHVISKSTESEKVSIKTVVKQNEPASSSILADNETSDAGKSINEDKGMIALLNKSELDRSENSLTLNEGTQNTLTSLSGNNYTPASSSISLNTNNALSLEFRGSSYRSTQTPTIDPKHYSPLNNMALALSYNINNNLSAGLDVRQETFFLRYNSIQNGEQFIYEQQPNFTTFSATVKYKLDGWGGFRPFASASAGANSIGFVGRAMLGAEYNVFGNFSIMLGVDFSNLTYTHQNNYFNSSKFGLNYGLIYSF